jgi:transformation/transcription domain-associated protein
LFLDIWESHLIFFFKQCERNGHLLAIPQHFLVTPNSPPTFTGLVLRYLVDNLEFLSGPDQEASLVLMKMFKVLFMSVSMFPERHEAVLIHHIAPFVMGILKWASKSREPRMLLLFFNLC